MKAWTGFKWIKICSFKLDKDGEFLDHLSDYQFHKDFAP